MQTSPPIWLTSPARRLTEAERLLEFNDNHDSSNGEFTSGGGSSAGASGSRAKPSSPPQSDTAEDYARNSTLHQTEMKAYTTSLNKEQADALKEYSHNGYRQMNSFLRGGGNLDGAGIVATRSKALIASMRPIPESVVVYRGINSERPEFSKKGKVITDKGFLSTSIDVSIAEAFSKTEQTTVARFTIPKGVKVGYANYQKEQEVILPPNAKFRVASTRMKGKTRIVEMEYVRPRK